MPLMGSTTCALLEGVHTGEESTGIFQKCFTDCLYQSEMLVEGTDFKNGIPDLTEMEGPSEATTTRTQTSLVADYSL